MGSMRQVAAKVVNIPLKLNLGCGDDLRLDHVNVDMAGNPDVRHDLTVVPWPWKTSTVSEVHMYNILEHLPDTVAVMKEIYRICEPDAKIFIRVPHPRHDDFLSDPTHVRPITVKLMWLFSKKNCEFWRRNKSANTPLAFIHDVDFEVAESSYGVEQEWLDKVAKGLLTNEQLEASARLFNNVIREIDITLRVVK